MSLPQNLTQPQLQRLKFIDFCLEYFGQLSRADLLNQFQTGVASSTRDLSLYRECAPANMVLRHQTKLHYRTPEFEPLFAHDADEVLRSLSAGKSDGLKLPVQPGQLCVDALSLISAPSNIVATLMRAITQKQALVCRYVSLSSGEGNRELVPHALANSGLRWHARCFDRQTQSFRDFVCTRFLSVKILDGEVLAMECAGADHAWNRIHQIRIVPHPALNHPKAIELDFGMSEKEMSGGSLQNGVLDLELRVALLGYVARHWRIDCSLDRSLDPLDYPLALAEPKLVANLAEPGLLPGASKSNGVKQEAML